MSVSEDVKYYLLFLQSIGDGTLDLKNEYVYISSPRYLPRFAMRLPSEGLRRYSEMGTRLKTSDRVSFALAFQSFSQSLPRFGGSGSKSTE